MWFATFIVKNVVRRPLRSVLTIVAIAIAIGSVVSLVGIAQGFEHTFATLYQRKGIDVIVVRSGGRNRLNSSLPESLGDKLRQLQGVKQVLPGLVDVMSLQDYGIHSVIVQGWIPETAVFDHLKVEGQGRKLSQYDHKAVMLGSILAKSLNKGVGDTIQLLEDEPFQVVGIFQTHNVFEDGAMVVPLAQLQRIMDRPRQVTGYSLILDEDAKKDKNTIPELRNVIQGLEKNISALATQEHVDSLTEIQVVKAMAWLTSAIALAIGLFGVMNTMVMAVHERTREIGILRAVGWRPYRVMRLVLLEAVALSQFGALLGVIGSAILLRILTRMPTVAGLIDGQLQPMLVLYGFLIAAGVGLIGGILPARRAARVLPTVALRQE